VVGRVLLGHSYFRQDDALLMLRELFANRAAILVPLTVYLFSPLWLARVARWSVAIADGQLPACLPRDHLPDRSAGWPPRSSSPAPEWCRCSRPDCGIASMSCRSPGTSLMGDAAAGADRFAWRRCDHEVLQAG